MNTATADAFKKWIHGVSWEKSEHDSERFFLFVKRYWEEGRSLPDCRLLRDLVRNEVLTRGDWERGEPLDERVAFWVNKAELIMSFLTATYGK